MITNTITGSGQIPGTVTKVKGQGHQIPDITLETGNLGTIRTESTEIVPGHVPLIGTITLITETGQGQTPLIGHTIKGTMIIVVAGQGIIIINIETGHFPGIGTEVIAGLAEIGTETGANLLVPNLAMSLIAEMILLVGTQGSYQVQIALPIINLH